MSRKATQAPRPAGREVTKVSAAGPPKGLIAVVVVLVVALVGGLVLWAFRGDPDPAAGASELEASGSANALPQGGGVRIGPGPEADVPQVRLYEDFQCPWCGVLEEAVGEELASRAEAGEITMTYTLMSFLEGGPDGESSHQAANAALCADDAGAFTAYHAAVFAGQPDEEGAGWTQEQLLGFADGAGLDGAETEQFTSCVEDDIYGAYVEDMQARADLDEVTGTPHLVVGEHALEADELQSLWSEPGTLDEVLEAHS
ncbi:DsbA family protein [Serinicoccus sp. LYQ131]|uniref:DsbA family protein n=1 Tax=Serinicoccus sp. LYQ131 TaxID=3378797 RepID=UPI003852A4F9